MEHENAVGVYLRDKASKEPVSVDRRVQLAIEAKAGNQKARDELVYSLGGLIIEWTKKYYWKYRDIEKIDPAGWSFDDVYMMVVEGVLQGIDRFDETREGAALVACCLTWANGVVMMQVNRRVSEKAGSSVMSVVDVRKLRRIRWDFERRENRVPNKEELRRSSELAKWEKVRFERAYRNSEAGLFAEVPMDAPLEEGGANEGLRLLDRSVDVERDIIRKDAEEKLRSCVGKFRARIKQVEAHILDKNIFTDEPMTLAKVGEAVGVSRQRVHQIRGEVINKLELHFRSAGVVPEDFLTD
ncbi:hypothetical protein CVV38_00090 [Candidatus Peregrinibacteria bacterium HGW-Peregrinibacteria-1]|jgi:RNA polymerase sigma factor (sigma-70 family)|nr:MAG: hypothetical protein CVV38_00090 [Candidatus Peregrinibacteria bacterium HGW-Peregrinibacteria-1]